MTPQESADALEAALHEKWVSEWRIHDLALLIMEQGEVFAREVSALGNDAGHLSKLRRWADLARQYPPHTRSPEYSPAQHRRWLREAAERPSEATDTLPPTRTPVREG